MFSTVDHYHTEISNNIFFMLAIIMMFSIVLMFLARGFHCNKALSEIIFDYYLNFIILYGNMFTSMSYLFQ